MHRDYRQLHLETSFHRKKGVSTIIFLFAKHPSMFLSVAKLESRPSNGIESGFICILCRSAVFDDRLRMENPLFQKEEKTRLEIMPCHLVSDEEFIAFSVSFSLFLFLRSLLKIIILIKPRKGRGRFKSKSCKLLASFPSYFLEIHNKILFFFRWSKKRDSRVLIMIRS